MRERPILFSGAMVRAIRQHVKTMTRRVVKLHPDNPGPRGVPAYYTSVSVGLHTYDNDRPPLFGAMFRADAGGDVFVTCPYGAPGDRLWVKETFVLNYGPGMPVAFRADWDDDAMRGTAKPPKWKPSIFIPRAVSRLTLEVTNVRCERLQAISEEDARAEGIVDRNLAPLHLTNGPCSHCGRSRGEHSGKVLVCNGLVGGVTFSNATARGGFAYLWNTINGDAAPWVSNPWVWVVEFKLVEAGE